MNSQQLILDLIGTRVAADKSVVLIHDRQYANTGTLRTLAVGTLRQIAAVTYDFQSDCCHFGPSGNRVAAHWYGRSADGLAAYVKGSIPELVAAVVDYLTTKQT